ncbi:SDR family NAD(P)-dependent oxidoreductase [Mitsuaria sp. WAJ17]|uniref:SDR family NAD(P)-dependent oxidoreductase n=1 Tax=Mitsuaria sp. WAJ17 TaxID=2761452 RepID=UPI0016019931|nr:SDR family NAD(P)-dependent oxidoreductase [Mitsuaria sp. WAJ17]MBB2486772.1 SDR family NAD(P)-dependent oxidoreductase [Mitsuaria sp. WAJ17]
MGTTEAASRRRIVIVGASSAMAERCARLWLLQSPDCELILLGRHAERLQRVAGDLRVRAPQASISCRVLDFSDPEAIASAAADCSQPRAPDLVLIAHGLLPDQAQAQDDLALARLTLYVNGISPVLFAEAFVARMQAVEGARLAIIGSVAGDRGRQSNYVYGAAKGLLERYAEGLQHRLALQGRPLRVVLIKPGPTATPMTAGLQGGPGALAPVETVAEGIVKGMAQGRPVVYVPGKWRLIMAIIRCLPRAVMHRLKI